MVHLIRIYIPEKNCDTYGQSIFYIDVKKIQ